MCVCVFFFSRWPSKQVGVIKKILLGHIHSLNSFKPWLKYLSTFISLVIGTMKRSIFLQSLLTRKLIMAHELPNLSSVSFGQCHRINLFLLFYHFPLQQGNNNNMKSIFVKKKLIY